MNNFVVNTDDTYFLDNIYNDIDILCNKYNHILTKEVIGKSVEGRDIIGIKFNSNINSNAKNKSALLLVGGIHAREDFSVMLVMKMLDYYCYHYNEETVLEKYNIKKIMDNCNIHFVPVANPDGLNIVHHGLEASSNYNKLKDMKIWGDDYSFWKANANGVDLNKNFDDGNWDIRLCVPGTDVPCSDRFKGFKPNSEPETNALINYCNNNNFSILVSYHCSGNCTFWADSGTHHLFGGLDKSIMDEFASSFIYRKTKISKDPAVYGCGFENWFRKKIKRPAFCIELSPYVEGGKQHPDNMFNELVWKYAKHTGLFFGEKAIEVDYKINSVEKYAALTE